MLRSEIIDMDYFLTFRTYGTWLHGDERGSVDRRNNQFGEPLLPPAPDWQQSNIAQMKSAPCTFNQVQRRCVHETLCEVASFRNWYIHALSVQSNHVHIVVSVPENVSAERAMNDFKAWATRRLRENNHIEAGRVVWERHGSTRHLRYAHEISAACDYVLNRQTKPEEPCA
jgi:REP element-mobilizing transposase RayT